MFVRSARALALALALLIAAVAMPAAQSRPPAVTAPKAHFGFNIGDDYHLATYTQLTEYWQKLDKESDRMSGAGAVAVSGRE